MNSKIGERLEEARKRQGISVREASESTKIRGDFLLHFENNYFDFDLPEVYKEGFIKIYSRYLKLSPEKMLNDYRACRQNARQFLSPVASRPQQQNRESLGSMALPQQQAQKKVSEMVSDFEEDNEEEKYFEQPLKSSQSPYLKVGLMFGGGFAAIFAMVFLMSSLMSGKKSPQPTEPVQQVAQAQKPAKVEAAPATQAARAGQLKLIADSDVHVVVRQESDKQTLFYGTLNKDSEKVLNHEGPVKVRFNDGANLTIVNMDGKRIKPGRSGSGWIEVS